MFASQDQDRRRAGTRGLTRNNHGAVARRLRRAAAGAACAAALALPLFGAAAAQAATTTATFTPLTLVNGWTNYGSGTANAAVASINGIVHLKGAIKTTGTNPVPFTLPKADRPAARVYVPVDMCGASNGRLEILPSGEAFVEPEGGAWNEAQCLTSLDGVTFAKSAASFTPLALQNGWAYAGYSTASPAARNISGIVHLQGAISTTGTNPMTFTLPPGDAPATYTYVPVDMCDGTNGRLVVEPSGSVSVAAEGGAWSNASCFTSLDGVSFATSASSFTPLTLQNGWNGFPAVTASPAVRVIAGIVHLKGVMYTNGTNPVAFTLPTGDRPAHDVYVKVGLGDDAGNGQLFITPRGSVTVQAEGGNWTSAQAFTSLDGASFAR